MFSKDISLLDRKEKGKIKSEQHYKALNRKYDIEGKGLKLLMEKLKQRLGAKKVQMAIYGQ